MKSRPGRMANGETQRNQCQRWFEGKWFVRSLASTKLLHKFPFIRWLSVLACGYMWVQTGYFEIKNLGVDNSLETKVKHRLHLGERWSKKDVFYQALGIWSGSSSLFEADAHGSLVLEHHKGIFLIWKITLCLPVFWFTLLDWKIHNTFDEWGPSVYRPALVLSCCIIFPWNFPRWFPCLLV